MMPNSDPDPGPAAPRILGTTSRAQLFGAIGTPLDEHENLHVEALAQHLDEQWRHGVAGVLIAGTMGCLPLLREHTYADLVRQSIPRCTGRGETFVGVGDTSFARTLDRIQLLNDFRVDGVVVITPYFLPFSQEELIDYFRQLADRSKNPLYLYDIPARARVKLELPTVLALAKHPNIRGIKCSADPDWARELIGEVKGGFRVIVAAIDQLHVLLREGIPEHLDGLFALMPHWAGQTMSAADSGDWAGVERYAARFRHLLATVRSMGSFSAYTALARMRGIPGNFAPAPLRQLREDEIAMLRDDPCLQNSAAT